LSHGSRNAPTPLLDRESDCLNEAETNRTNLNHYLRQFVIKQTNKNPRITRQQVKDCIFKSMLYQDIQNEEWYLLNCDTLNNNLLSLNVIIQESQASLETPGCFIFRTSTSTHRILHLPILLRISVS